MQQTTNAYVLTVHCAGERKPQHTKRYCQKLILCLFRARTFIANIRIFVLDGRSFVFISLWFAIFWGSKCLCLCLDACRFGRCFISTEKIHFFYMSAVSSEQRAHTIKQNHCMFLFLHAQISHVT